MEKDERSDRGSPGDAEAAFAEFLRRKEAGGDLEFERFCAERPEIAGELRILRALHAGEVNQEVGPNWTLPLSALRSVLPICAEFEAACQRGERPRIEDLLRKAGEQERPHLFRELLLLELDHRRKNAESPSREEYRRRFPEHAEIIEQIRFEPSGPRPQHVGPYRILDVLGEGGMGVVYLAEQREPIQRKVALKVIKLGMDTKEVIGRFEAERQALALMDHPNIARVHDAGSTEDGRPYFVMELFQGVPITEYCDHHKLSIKQRLELFLQVCQGVEHAHHRGIIHRDIKPGNILVSTPDEVPVAKIIDFGVAKATNQRLTEKTVYTELGQVVGTPAYMSPEQAGRTAESVDHRTDIYSLGVVLYELLVGEPPFDPEALSKAAYDEILRRVREEEPPTPSTRWTRLSVERTTQLATCRRTSPGALAREVHGDLDWITMKAIEKERERRYSTAHDLAEDIKRYLKTEPVLAGPPSAAYRLKKYVRRHRTLVLATSSVVLALTLGLVVNIASLVRATRSEAVAKAQLEEILRLSDMKDLETYRLEAEALWPASSSKVEAMEEWLKKARGLVKHLPEHRRTLESLRAKALPYSDEAAKNDRKSHPKANILASWLESKNKHQEEIAKFERVPKDPAATILSYGGDEKKKHPTYYFRHAFQAEGPKVFELQFSLLSDDGAVVYLNGMEVLRANMPTGPIGYTTIAKFEHFRAGNYRIYNRKLAKVKEGLIKGRNLLAVEVHPVSRERPDLRFDLELLGLRLGESVRLVSKGSSWRYSDQGEDLGEAWKTPAYVDSSWKVGTGAFGYGFVGDPEKLLDLKQAAEKKAERLAEYISSLEKEVSARRTWEFAETRDRWRHDALQDLVVGLDEFAGSTLSIVEKGVEIVRRSKEKWDEAIASIRNKNECPKYGELPIKRQGDLVPLGRDPQSGLWEFAHIGTGEVPKRGDDGKLILTEETGIVFVLVPGGTFRMGAVKPDKTNPKGLPNVDPQAEEDEGPVHEVTLAPFFISKYEMTQGQWARSKGGYPSSELSALKPVTQVSWGDCQWVIYRMGLVLPTEAQWEYAARAGTSTVWWTGNEEKAVLGAENLDSPRVSPIGSFKPNAFGLHDMAGNVREWCQDRYGEYYLPWKAGDGERQFPMNRSFSRELVSRGGYIGAREHTPDSAFSARSAYRGYDEHYDSSYRDRDLGLRPARVITE